MKKCVNCLKNRVPFKFVEGDAFCSRVCADHIYNPVRRLYTCWIHVACPGLPPADVMKVGERAYMTFLSSEIISDPINVFAAKLSLILVEDDQKPKNFWFAKRWNSNVAKIEDYCQRLDDFPDYTGVEPISSVIFIQ